MTSFIVFTLARVTIFYRRFFNCSFRAPEVFSFARRECSTSAAQLFRAARHIQTPADIHNKVEGLNTRYYRLNKAQQGAETEIRTMTEHLRMYELWQHSWRYQRKLERLNPKRRKRFEIRHASKLHAYRTAIDYFAAHELSMEDWNPPRWKSRLEKACKERYDCECVQTDIKKELECLETIRQAMNEMHRMQRQRRPENDRGER